MINSSDDFPHPVPPLAYVRWKENYFFLIMDPEKKLFGMLHFNSEPAFDRLRINCNFQIDGKPFFYLKESPYPENFAMSPTISDGSITLTIHKSHEHLSIRIDTDELDGEFHFRKRLPTFDFEQCKFAAPELVSFKEAMTMGYNLPFNHIQQAVTVTGGVTVRESKERVDVDCYGYRDHSWCMRSDNMVQEHSWCGMNFPGKVFGVMTGRMLGRPEVECKEGYVADEGGIRPLRKIELEYVYGGSKGLPDKVIHHIEDVFGKAFTLESDVKGCFAQVPLFPEGSAGKAVYEVAEVFTPTLLRETGEMGVSLVELGKSSAVGGLQG